MKTLSLRVADDLDRKLETVAKKLGTSKSDLMREALEAFLAASGGLPGSCLDMAGALMGCVESSPDLSVNKEHLKGFGE